MPVDAYTNGDTAGEFHRNNVLLDAHGAPWVIDGSNVRVSDPRVDLAWARVILNTDDGEDAALYEATSGVRVGHLDIWPARGCWAAQDAPRRHRSCAESSRG